VIHTIVAGADLSQPSEQAINRAAALAQLHGAKLVLVSAHADDAPIDSVDNDMLQQLGEVSAAMRDEVSKHLAVLLDSIKQRGVDVELASPTGPPGEVLAQIAKDKGAELIVVGTHGHTGISRFLLGSVATSVLRHAPCDVLVVRGTTANGPFERPLVAIDYSPASYRALRNAAKLTRPGATIEIVHAWQLPVGSVGASLFGQARFPWSTIRDAVVKTAQAQADKLVAAHEALGFPLHVDLIQGPPASVITHAAERGQHDLISIGTHGRRGFRRLLLGSVAESVIRHAPCSVLVAHGEHAGETAKFTKV
jgi:nucleotide-binding universal stress UspA family protein